MSATHHIWYAVFDLEGFSARLLGACRHGLFGSLVRGKQDSESAADVLMELEPDRKCFDNFIRFVFVLEDLLQRPVELLTPESLSPYTLDLASYGRSSMACSVLDYLRHIVDEAEYLISRAERTDQR